jgi:hypothetical protein
MRIKIGGLEKATGISKCSQWNTKERGQQTRELRTKEGREGGREGGRREGEASYLSEFYKDAAEGDEASADPRSQPHVGFRVELQGGDREGGEGGREGGREGQGTIEGVRPSPSTLQKGIGIRVLQYTHIDIALLPFLPSVLTPSSLPQKPRTSPLGRLFPPIFSISPSNLNKHRPQ